jgi:N-methylhydantoinase A
MRFLGIDIGGTFTDVALMDESGALSTYKVPSDPGDPVLGVLEGIALAAKDQGVSSEEMLADLVRLAHGTTVATNTFLEHGGGRVGLITTGGFGDTILVQRMKGMTAGMLREEMARFSLRAYPTPVVPKQLIKEVDERLDYRGEVVVRLDEEGVRRALRELAEEGVDAIAVGFLWSFRNARHEQRVAELASEETPDIPVILSHEVAPVIGEYERVATTVISAYLRNSVARYLEKLQRRLADEGMGGPLVIMNSSGGVVPANRADQNPAELFLSGPTGGVVASKHLGEELEARNLITTDMGGTSFDVGLIVEGRYFLSNVSAVGKYHVAVPMIEVQTVGAGGGSIAQVSGGELSVGPYSAGASPGPACYGRGGEEPTVTDADLVLGILDPGYFLGGRVPLRRDLAEAVIEERVARPLGMSVHEAAGAIRSIVDSRMADVLHELTFEKGHDPRDFILLAYGGAGPTHCASYGRELGPAMILVPVTASVHSAYGGLASDVSFVFELSRPMRSPAFAEEPTLHLDPDAISAIFESLEEQGIEALRESGIPSEAMTFNASVDMRYRRQIHRLAVPFDYQDPDKKAALTSLLREFDEIYARIYGPGAAFPEAGLELTTFRLEAVGATPKPSMRREAATGGASPDRREDRDVYLWRRSTRREIRVYDGLTLSAGNVLEGPCTIDLPTTTIFVDDDQVGRVDEYLNVVIQPR